ncbi:MAG: TonB-dependent receptor [Bacteroidia bacterium]|nr:TonB-dependent receptor [Bacteroidia bacterium]
MMFLSMLMLLSVAMHAQITVRGTVRSTEDGTEMQGVSVLVKGTTTGVFTDQNGAYTLRVADGNAVLVFKYYGYMTREVTVGDQTTVDVSLELDVQTTSEVVLIGYGTQKKKDLTGAVVAITSKDFIQGNLNTPEQLIAGKVAGVQITSNGGAPGAGSRIRIRGGASLNASNDPLIVIDGVPVDNNGISGAANPLSLINPNDIESFNILKDASATAIYGSRASNGVIIITTKKGRTGDKLAVNYNAVFSLAQRTGQIEVLSADEFREVVNERGNAAQKALLGNANTNWQDVIFRDAFSMDHNVSLTGATKTMPYRLSVGYLNQNGILKTSNMQRTSAALGLTPSFFDDHLRVDINLKGAYLNNFFADQGAIGSAVAFDPTQPVNVQNEFGGYFEWLDPSTGDPNQLAPRNPLGLLESRRDVSNVLRSIGNAQLDYRFHFLPDLRANLNVGYDISSGQGTRDIPANAAAAFARGGVDAEYDQSKINKTLDFYLNYARDIAAIDSRVDVMAGYSYQDFIRENTDIDLNLSTPADTFTNSYYKTQNTLVSFYGRLNYTFKGRYLLTFTLRQDGSSRFSPENRWGLFPSAAFAWRVVDEAFLRNSSVVSDLKVRLGYGVTGQQDVFSDYPYLPRYTPSENNAQYQFGNNFYQTLRPEGYDANIKWEQTETYNIGVDFGFAQNRITGSVDYYTRNTKDLLSVIPVPAGSNLTNQILTNVGNIENEGVEVTLNFVPVQREKLNFTFGANFTYNQNTITNLTKVADPTFPGILVGGISGGVGNTIQIHTVGFPTAAFFVYRQVYDETGMPVEGLYVDENGDGRITPDDRYRYKSPEPNYFVGASAQLIAGNFSAGFVLRGSIGNYMYNNINSNQGVYRNVTNASNFLANMTPSVLESGFSNNQFFSDYYIENASFLRLDNVTLGYNLGALLNGKLRAQVTAIGQNMLTITKYTGLDPEIAGGIDNNLYPRPRTLSLGINLTY